MKTLTDFERIAKKSKQRSRLKTVVISVSIAILSFGLISKGLTELTSRNGNHIKDRYLLLSEIAYPNISYSSWYFNPTSNYTGQFHSDRFKSIDGIDVPYEQMEAFYSIRKFDLTDSSTWITWSEDGKSAYTRSNYYKSPMFHNIAFDYDIDNHVTVTNDISLTDQMTGQAVEMAVTFDKPYTYQEIQKMVPDNLLINWYWIGSYSDFDTASRNPDAQLGLSADPEGKLGDYDFELFRTNLKKANDNTYLGMTETAVDANDKERTYQLSDDAKAYLDENKDLETAQFSGVILTGRAENFKELKDKKWIFAANIGQSVQIQPYHHLTK